MSDGAPPPPPPRRFRLRAIDASALFLLLFGGIWGLVGTTVSVVFMVMGGPPWDDLILDRRNAVVIAMPVGVAQASGQINGRPVYRIGYTFADGAGHTQVSASTTTEPELVQAARARAPLTVEYDPLRPRRSRVQGQSASMFGLFVLLPCGFAVIGGVLLVLGLRRVLRLRAIYVHGRAARATVTAVSRSALRVNGRYVMRVDYVFDAGSGGSMTPGRTTMRDPPPVGAQLWIVYVPADPGRSVAAL